MQVRNYLLVVHPIIEPTEYVLENPPCFVFVAVGDAYKMHFIGYAPYRLPHSEDTLLKQLKSRGLTFKSWRATVIRRTKTKVLRDFLTKLLKPVFGFGDNCYQVSFDCR